MPWCGWCYRRSSGGFRRSSDGLVLSPMLCQPSPALWWRGEHGAGFSPRQSSERPGLAGVACQKKDGFRDGGPEQRVSAGLMESRRAVTWVVGVPPVLRWAWRHRWRSDGLVLSEVLGQPSPAQWLPGEQTAGVSPWGSSARSGRCGRLPAVGRRSPVFGHLFLRRARSSGVVSRELGSRFCCAEAADEGLMPPGITRALEIAASSGKGSG